MTAIFIDIDALKGEKGKLKCKFWKEMPFEYKSLGNTY